VKKILTEEDSNVRTGSTQRGKRLERRRKRIFLLVNCVVEKI